MSHLHHIVPKHMGGTDDPNNLIELSIEDHAEAHKKLFEEHGHWQDYLAWQGLSKMIPHEELISMVQSEAAKERLKLLGNPFSGIQTQYNFSINEEFRKQVSSLANSPEAIAKKKVTWGKTGRGKAEKNSQYGTCWVYHTEHGNKKIKKELLDDYLEMGYNSGRVMKL
jgi:hypothetical protein